MWHTDDTYTSHIMVLLKQPLESQCEVESTVESTGRIRAYLLVEVMLQVVSEKKIEQRRLLTYPPRCIQRALSNPGMPCEKCLAGTNW